MSSTSPNGPPAATTRTPGARLQPWWRSRWFRAIVTISVLAFGCGLIALRWDAYRPVLASARPGWLIAATALLLAGNLLSTLVSRDLLAARGTQVPVPQMARIVLVSNVAKYVPGFVAQIATYYQMARRVGIDRRGIVVLWVEATWLTLTVTAGMGGVALLVVDSPVPWWFAVLVVVCSCLSLIPRVRHAVLVAVRLLPSGPDELGGFQARPMALACLGVVLLGAHGMALAHAVGVDDLTLAEAIAAWAGGWVVGLLAFVFPGGIGPRELVASSLLSAFTSPTVAVVLVVLSRLATVVADVIGGAGALVLPVPNRATRAGAVGVGESTTARAPGG